MGVDAVKETLEQPKNAIIEILVQAYLERIELEPEEEVIDLESQRWWLRRNGKNIATTVVRTQPGLTYKKGLYRMHDPLVGSPQKGIGTILYLKTAINLARQNKRLYSPGIFVVDDETDNIKPAQLVWQRLARNGLANQDYGDEGFTFIDLSEFDLTKMETIAKEKAERIKAEGTIEDSLTDIKVRLKNASRDSL